MFDLVDAGNMILAVDPHVRMVNHHAVAPDGDLSAIITTISARVTLAAMAALIKPSSGLL